MGIYIDTYNECTHIGIYIFKCVYVCTYVSICTHIHVCMCIVSVAGRLLRVPV